MEVIANARLMVERMTGQPRYFMEVSRRLQGLVRCVAPERRLSRVRNHLWEQRTLPGRTRGALLWSPSNTGPLSVSNQVVTIHDVSMLEHPEWFSRAFAAWYRFVLPRLAKRVMRIMTVSEDAKRRICDGLHVAPEKVFVTPNGVDDRMKSAGAGEVTAVREKYKLARPYVLAVASVQPRKNFQRLVEAWGRSSRLSRDYDLVIAGGTFGVFRSVALDRSVAGLRPLGYVEDGDLPALYGGASAFVYPSLYEGFGMPIIEAMACGVPVVTSNVTSLPEVAGDAAVLVDPYSVDSIAAGIEKVLDDPAFSQELRRRGQLRAAEFTWDRTADLTRKVLEACIAELQ